MRNMNAVLSTLVLFSFQFIDTASSTAVAAAASPASSDANAVGSTKKALADGAVREYCQWEEFAASCSTDEVIVITRASYGRPTVGRCVKPEYGHVGCFKDVRPLADALCSGRQQCQITVTDKIFEGMTPCREDLKLHLEIGYTCVKVLQPIGPNCRNVLPASSVTPASSPSSSTVTVRPVAATGGSARGGFDGVSSGVLASFSTTLNGCGSPGSPWLISVGPGQRVNVSLIDFSLVGFGSGGNGSASSGYRGGMGHGRNQGGMPYCQVYAIIKEQGGQQGVTVCSSEGVHDRERPVYLSTTNAVEIRILTARSTKDTTVGYFMLRYQPVGCTDVETPNNVWWKRDGDNATAGCRTSSGQSSHQRVWHSTCVGNTWMGDFPDNCPDVASPSQGSWSSTTHSVTATLIILIACFVGLAVFAAGFCIIHRRCFVATRKAPYESTMTVGNSRPILSKDDAKSMAETYGRSSSTKYDPRSTYHSAAGLRQYAPTTTTQGPHYMARAADSTFDDACCGNAVDNEYAYVDEIYGSHGYTTCTGVAPPPPPANNNVGVRSAAAAVPLSASMVVRTEPQVHQQQQDCAVELTPGVCYQYKFAADDRLPADEVDGVRDTEVMYWQRQQRQYHHQQQQQIQQLQQQQAVVGSLSRHQHFMA